ncbi:hypothetical protein BGW38_005293 [Lunasporangiospora selenospora]|uniref:Uncharacterized protein n=1 Tax=Lunasporangiospora selenospora TaxID=979761 RepID=A0A9P6KBL6_9FUNG|nr:hypothetical protein BGW38_005293 [Lunasporangiospora selenospora]
MSSPEASSSTTRNDATLVEEEPLVLSEDDQETNTGLEALAKSRKTPFRLFTSDSIHSKRLLQAMLLKPPFDKLGGPVHKRWMSVVGVLKESAQQELFLENGGPDSEEQDSQRNIYWNVEVRTCRLAWDKFKSELKEHDKQRSKKTGAVADETEWLTLIRSVVEVEELEEDRRMETVAAASRKRSAELMEQNNRDGARLRDAAMMEEPRRRVDVDSGSETANSSEPRRARRRRNNTELRSRMEEFIKNTEEKIIESTRRTEESHRRQEDRHTTMMIALNNTSTQISQLVSMQMQDREALRIERDRASQERARHLAMDEKQQKTNDRQATATEALLNFLAKQ